MNQSLVHGHALLRVERLTRVRSKIASRHNRRQAYQRPSQEVEGVLRGFGEQSIEWSPFADWQCADVISRPSRSDPIKLIQRRCANDVKYQIELVAVVTTGEKWLPIQQLRENAPDSPKVDGLLDGQRRQQLFTKAPTFVYILNESMISGARYHLVATYSVIKPTSFPCEVEVLMLRAKPKSQTLRSQFALSKRFAGFRSR